jgi:hypothetical protein
MALRVHGRVTLEVDGEPVHLDADGSAWTATVRRFRTLRGMLAALPPLPPPIAGTDPLAIPATLNDQGIDLEIRDGRGPLLRLGRGANGRRLRIPFLIDVPHARIAGPLALLRLLF